MHSLKRMSKSKEGGVVERRGLNKEEFPGKGRLDTRALSTLASDGD